MSTASETSAAPARVAVVIGGSRGIGRASAERLAGDRFAVVVVHADDSGAAEHTVGAVRAAEGQAFAMRADVADEDAVAEVFDRAEDAFGGVDVVVNAAGRMILAPVAELDLADLDALYRTNIRGAFVVAQRAARRLRPGGALINLSASAVGTSLPTYGAYAASNGAVEALTLVLARELRGQDVTVNAVAPGPTAAGAFLDGASRDELETLVEAVPLQRLGRPTDVAQLVAFLASPGGHWVNGQNIRVNGGLV